jgi:hypothetical protein
MALDLNASGAKVIDGSGGGTSAGDPLRQTVQINQANIGAVAVTETALESALGTTADTNWAGSGVASLVALLKAIALRGGVGGTISDGSGTISVSGLAQYIFSGLTPANGYLVQNTHATATLYINDVGVAAATGSSLVLLPGQMWVTPPGYKPPGAVSLFGNTSGQSFSARRW